VTIKKKNTSFIMILLIIINILFILLNSLAPGSVSNAFSGYFAEKIKYVLDPENKYSYHLINGIIRKAAHFTVFAMLGAETMLLHIINRKPRLFTLLFILLSVAVADETLQSFSDRTDSIRDVILDFSGAVLGMAAMVIIYYTAKLIINIIKKLKSGKEIRGA
jgi:VanZ family protein